MFKNVYSKVPKSASVWLVKETSLKNGFDYTIGFFKRNQNTSFGGFWAQPGGIVDEQDHYDAWEEVYPKYTKSFGHFHDFTLRMCCLRELYEECSILPAYKNEDFSIITGEELEKSEYDTDQFHLFCKDREIYPAIDRLSAFKRISPPLSLTQKRVDTQMYFYFLSEDEEKHIKLNESELTAHKFVSPKEAFESLSMFPPQQICTINLSQFCSFSSLKEFASDSDKHLISYCEFRANLFQNNAKLITEGSKLKSLDDYYPLVFNKYDLLGDQTRKDEHGLRILTENENMKDCFTQVEIKAGDLETYADIFTKLKSNVIFVFPGDYFHTNESYPWKTHRYSRHRIYKGKGKDTRYEITQDVWDIFSKKPKDGLGFISSI
ncbi:unnamed protein product [Moneuplotes crassus]|uniref:Nudix hydrolase domain-containing protein n=1 Tax=Euplotes crassus TaxID=5936 RepID=A0AAD1XIN0_EUPCR|nr:unnamed protein product [Moneuplotes crassus]